MPFLRLRKEPDEAVGEEVQEEVTNDDFETQYKGEVSKSGVAIYLLKNELEKFSTNQFSSQEEDKDSKQRIKLKNKTLEEQKKQKKKKINN